MSDGAEFWTGGAASALLGSTGREMPREGGVFSRDDIRSWAKIAIVPVSKERLKITESMAANAGLSVAQVVKIGYNYESFTSQQLTAVRLEIDRPASLVEQIRNDPELMRKFRDPQYRVITSVVVVYDHESSEKLRKNPHIDLSVPTEWSGSIPIQFGGDAETTFSKSIADGVVIGYKWCRACWSPTGQLLDLVESRPAPLDGIGDCPKGSGVYHSGVMELKINGVEWRYQPENPNSPWRGPVLPIAFDVDLSNVVVESTDREQCLQMLRDGMIVIPHPQGSNKAAIYPGGAESKEDDFVMLMDPLPQRQADGSVLYGFRVRFIAPLHYETQWAEVAFRDATDHYTASQSVWGQKP